MLHVDLCIYRVVGKNSSFSSPKKYRDFCTYLAECLKRHGRAPARRASLSGPISPVLLPLWVLPIALTHIKSAAPLSPFKKNGSLVFPQILRVRSRRENQKTLLFVLSCKRSRECVAGAGAHLPIISWLLRSTRDTRQARKATGVLAKTS